MEVLDQELVSEEDALSFDNLRALINHETQVLRVPNFISPEACRNISKGLKSAGYSDYLNAPSVGRIGMSYFETGRKQEIVDHYFSTAIENMNILRKACAPDPCPIDTLRCILDETWPGGCGLQDLYSKKMFVGLSRCMKPGVPLLAHHDMFGRHAPNTPEAASLISQFGVNVYIDVPEVGGELAMWLNEISDEQFLERRRQHYGVPLDWLDPPDFTVKPQNGDLILFNARKMHAVLAGEGCDRLTISGFVGYRGINDRLTMWS
jgi:hypothetical protein